MLNDTSEHRIIVTKVGVGKVSSAIGLLTKIHQLQPSKVVNLGVAGGLGEIAVFDIVHGTAFIEWDFDLTPLDEVPRKKVFPQKSAEIPGCTDFILGTIATGDSFIHNTDQASLIKRNTGALCVDMEAASLCKVCNRLSIPFAALKSITDLAGSDAYCSNKKNLQQAMESLCVVIEELI